MFLWVMSLHVQEVGYCMRFEGEGVMTFPSKDDKFSSIALSSPDLYMFSLSDALLLVVTLHKFVLQQCQ